MGKEINKYTRSHYILVVVSFVATVAVFPFVLLVYCIKFSISYFEGGVKTLFKRLKDE